MTQLKFSVVLLNFCSFTKNCNTSGTLPFYLSQLQKPKLQLIADNFSNAYKMQFAEKPEKNKFVLLRVMVA